MVQIIENWSLLRGRVVRLAPAAEYSGFTAVELDVDGVSSVDGFPNLLQDRTGTRPTVFLPADQTHLLAPGKTVTFRARLAGRDRLFGMVLAAT